MKKVVFICKGNIFRSQTAKAFYNQLKKDDSFAVSYGVWVDGEGNQDRKVSSYPGLQMLVNEIKKYGLDISNEQANQLKEEYIVDADKIVVMAEREFIPEWLEKYQYEYWEVQNPEVHTLKFVEDNVKLIREKVLTLIG